MAINFEKKLEEATDEELHSWVNTRNPNFTVLASNELIRRALYKLHGIITTFNAQSSKQTEKMIRLTAVIIGLTIAMLIGLVVQIKLAVKQTNYTELQSRSERIHQARSIGSAIEFCEQNPAAEESGLFEISSGKPASCKQILKTYKK